MADLINSSHIWIIVRNRSEKLFGGSILFPLSIFVGPTKLSKISDEAASTETLFLNIHFAPPLFPAHLTRPLELEGRN